MGSLHSTNPRLNKKLHSRSTILADNNADNEENTLNQTSIIALECHSLAVLHKTVHYDYTPMQYIAIFHSCKNDNFQIKNCDIFLVFAKNIDCGYMLEMHQRGGSNEYPQSM